MLAEGFYQTGHCVGREEGKEGIKMWSESDARTELPAQCTHDAPLVASVPLTEEVAFVGALFTTCPVFIL